MKTYTIGVDLGGTNIKAGLVDEVHHIVDSVSCKTNLPRPEHEVEAEIAALCSQLAQRAGLDMATQIESVGIGTPGSVNPHTGVVEFNANFGYRNWPLVSAMEKLLPCRVYIENDANAAAYGEYIAGAAQGAKYAIAVTLGTGIGGGVSKEGDTLLAPVQAVVDQEDYAREGMRRTKIVTAKLRNDAGIIGAAGLATQHQ